MASTQGSSRAISTLLAAREALATSSRYRELNDLNGSERYLQKAEQFCANFYDLPASERDGLLELTNEIAAELALVMAILYWHVAPIEVRDQLFVTARQKAAPLARIFKVRVECCWGAVLVHDRRYQQAIDVLAAGRHLADARSVEFAQMSYHLARAQLAIGERSKAILTLRTVMPKLEDFVVTPTRYELAATVLLAETLWSLWSASARKEARKWLKVALQRSRQMPTTPECDDIKAIRTFGFLVVRFFQDKYRWPKI